MKYLSSATPAGLRSNTRPREEKGFSLYSAFRNRNSGLKKTPEGAFPGLNAGLKMKAELRFHNFCGLRPFGAFDDLEFYLLTLGQ
jgi:hypothetical protein